MSVSSGADNSCYYNCDFSRQKITTTTPQEDVIISELEETSAHKSANTHAGNLFVTHDPDI